MILIKDNCCKCEHCNDNMLEKDIRLIKWSGIGVEQFICSKCAKLYYIWKKSLKSKDYNLFVERYKK